MRTIYSSKFVRLFGGALSKDAEWEESKHPRDECGRFSHSASTRLAREVAEAMIPTSGTDLLESAKEADRRASALRSIGKDSEAAMVEALARDLRARAEANRRGEGPRAPVIGDRLPAAPPTNHPQRSVVGRATTMRLPGEIAKAEEVSGEKKGKGVCFAVTFKDGTAAAYKPTNGSVLKVKVEDEGLADRVTIDPSVSEAKRERAAFLLSEALGFDVVPPVELVDYGLGPDGGGHAMAWVRGDEAADVEIQYLKDLRDGHPDLHRIAILDFICGNIDRHLGNFMKGHDGRYYAIDNGLCFPRDMEMEMYWSDVQNSLAFKVMPDEVVEEVRAMELDSLGKIMAEAGLSDIDIQAALARLEVMRHVKGWGMLDQMVSAAEDMYFQGGGRRRPRRR